jgi:hypothetical protein
LTKSQDVACHIDIISRGESIFLSQAPNYPVMPIGPAFCEAASHVSGTKAVAVAAKDRGTNTVFVKAAHVLLPAPGTAAPPFIGTQAQAC